VFRLHQVGGAGAMESSEIQAHRFERPTGRAVPARHAAPHVLVEIYEHIQAEIAGEPADLGEVVEVIAIVEPGTTVLDRLPRRQEPQRIETPMAQPAQVLARLLERERPAD